MQRVVCAFCGRAFASQAPYPSYAPAYCGVKCRNFALKDHYGVPRPSTCLQCGKPFAAKVEGRKFCSHPCAMRYFDVHHPSRKYTPIPCAQCGTMFRPRNPTRRFCCYRCKANAMKGQPPHNKTNHMIICAHCGIEFHSPPTSTRKYCSDKCYWASMEQTVVGTCQNCGKAYNYFPCEQGRTKFCSPECKNEYLRGVRHPQWKDRIVKCCAYCAQEFGVIPARESSRFCSQVCAFTYTRKHLNKPTGIEQRIASVLDSLDVAYETERPFRRWFCDFVVGDSRLVIECDGRYWHDSPKQKLSDARKDNALRASGYTVLRLGEDTILSDIDSCKAQILAVITAASARP